MHFIFGLLEDKTMSPSQRKVPIMESKPPSQFIAYLAIIATPFALGAFLLAYAPAQNFNTFDPRYDGYTQPRDIGKIVEETQESTVTIKCYPPKRKDQSQGSGWAIDQSALLAQNVSESKTSIITNHHVIRGCLGSPMNNKVKIKKFFGKKNFIGTIEIWDKKNDLALISTDMKIPALQLSEYPVFPGYWVASIGSADGYEGSAALGTVFNLVGKIILFTNNISPGSSGGPLVDNLGTVVGTVTFGSTRLQYNGAMSLDAMCRKIIQCNGNFYWEFDEE